MEQEKKKFNLKIIIPIAIVIIVIVGIALLTNTNKNKLMSKQSMIKNASTLNIENYKETVRSNIVKAKEKYNGKLYKYADFVSDIKSNYAEIGGIKVYLNTNDLKLLNLHQKVEVVGTLSVSDEAYTYGKLENAFLVKDTFEITGTLNIEMVYGLHNEYWSCTLISGLKEYYICDFTTDNNTKIENVNVKDKDKVTIQGTIMEDVEGKHSTINYRTKTETKRDIIENITSIKVDN